MNEKIKVLILEDLSSDVELAERELKSVLKDYEVIVTYTEKDFVEALENYKPDLIISDYQLPTFDGMKALQITRKSDEFIPFIILTGSTNEETAVECMKAGADDYVIKENIQRLGPAVLSVLNKKKMMLERKKVEEELKLSEEKFRKAFTTSPDSININRLEDGMYVSINEGFTKITGYTEADVIGKTSLEISIWANPEDRNKLVEQLRKKGMVQNFEAPFRMKDGTIRYGIMSASVIAINGVPHIISITRDITERRKAEEELKKLSTAIEQSPSIITITDTEGRIEYVNPKFTEITGYRPEEVIGERANILNSGKHPPKMFKELWETISSGKIWRGEFHNKKKNGELYWEMASISPIFDKQGKIINYVKVAEDITQRKLAEERLFNEREKLLITLQSIGDGVITTDKKGRVTFLNRVAEQMTGWKNEEAIGQPLEKIFKIINEKTGKPAKNPVKKVLDSGNIVEMANDTALISKDGIQRSIADTASPILDAQGKITGVVLVFRDVTDKKKREEELLKIKKLESIGILAGGIAHDFNNILTAILGNINLANHYIGNEQKVRRLLQEAEKASLRAKDLTQQLLTFSKGGEPVKETTSIKEVITDSAEFVLHGSNVRCRYIFPEDLWLVDIDTGQMSQVIQNLVINARHAMPEGGEIIISGENIADIRKETNLNLPGEKYIKITITDHGCGIPEKYLDKIFDPYFSTKQDGSGLGLAITYSIIKKHDGHITVESEPGKGTTFTIYLPASEEQIFTGTEEELENTEETMKATVLVVDDEQMIQELAKEMLVYLGHEVLLAKDGEEAIEIFKERYQNGNPIDLVIMDLTMPGGMGGKETIKEILKIDPDAKVIVSSGYSNDPVMANYSQYGFKAALVKPFKMEQLKKTLNSLLSQKNIENHKLNQEKEKNL